MSLSPEKWQQVKDLFQAAAERGPEERQAFLHEACGADHELLCEVASLLNFDEQARVS